jgi:hypothetical protein
VQLEKFVFSKRSCIARGIRFCGQSRFLTGKERRFGMTKCNVVQTAPIPENAPLPQCSLSFIIGVAERE